MDDPWLVVGLGNPGPRYELTRHNVGQLVLDVLAERARAKFRAHPRGRADVIETRLGTPPGTRAVLARPRSYMNTSGSPVASLSTYYKVPPERIVLLYDEMDLPFGTLRLKLGGGDNGHNGVRSVRASLDTGEFHRMRFGLGRPPGRQDPADYVLSDFSSTERKELPYFLDRAADAVECLVVDGLERAQNVFHAS